MKLFGALHRLQHIKKSGIDFPCLPTFSSDYMLEAMPIGCASYAALSTIHTK